MKILCVGLDDNSAPMYAAMLQKQFKGRSRHRRPEVTSAGIRMVDDVTTSPEWHALRQETKVDLSRHRARFIGDVNFLEIDFVICVDHEAFEFLQEGDQMPKLLPVAMQAIPAPSADDLDSFRHTFEVIGEAVAIMARLL